MCAKPKNGSLPDPFPTSKLLRRPSLHAAQRCSAQRRHSIRSYGTPFQQVPQAARQKRTSINFDVLRKSSYCTSVAPDKTWALDLRSFGEVSIVCRRG